MSGSSVDWNTSLTRFDTAGRRGHSGFMAPEPGAALAGAARPGIAEDPPEFPGCRPVRVTAADLDDYHGRFEYWDRDTETAFVVREPTSVYHEGPGQRLSALLALIAAVRGAPILTLGTSDLALRDARGERRRIMQADQIVYLDPAETQPRGPWVEVGSDHLPDVVLEVDYSTDVRRGKLGLYEAWGFPEVWVEVPAVGSPRRRPGLTIHRRSADGYRAAAASVALPGWTASEIHAALNEPALSESTRAVLERVGRALGEAGGTGPDDDLWLGAQRREARAEGHAAGHAQGHAAGHVQGRAQGRAEERAQIVGSILRSRGLAVSERLAARIAGEDPAVLAAAALACRDEADLLARLETRSRPAGPGAGRRSR